MDLGTHLIDLSRWFLGDLSCVSAVLSNYFWNAPVEDNIFATLVDPSGKVSQIQASCTEWKNLFRLEIYGREGKLQVDGLGSSYGLEQLTFYKMLPTMGPPETTIWQYPFPDVSWRAEIDELIDAIVEDRKPIGCIQDALQNLYLIDSIYRDGVHS
jgi:predicted dehydrogenase